MPFCQNDDPRSKEDTGGEGSSAENVAESYSNRNFANPSFRKPRFAGSMLTLQVPRNLSLRVSGKTTCPCANTNYECPPDWSRNPRKRFAALIESGPPVC
ncbi:hypothetical protein CEXT_139291 [Caerostris extrusa]|uniref:Uncharacterized protein n=1 Tax=Caerostris extrusa TaxID=172846 RepID=A0AAV4XUB2_CAEEX|nr:hypothetical protein CEXT_139291 [Caerostris extrusa]